MPETVTPCDGDTSAAWTAFGFARTALTTVVWPIGSCRGYAFSILSCCASAGSAPGASHVAAANPTMRKDRLARYTDTSCVDSTRRVQGTWPMVSPNLRGRVFATRPQMFSNVQGGSFWTRRRLVRSSEGVPQPQLHRPRQVRVDRL